MDSSERTLTAKVTAEYSEDALPALSPEDAQSVWAWAQRDRAFQQRSIAARRRNQTRLQELSEEILRGQDWLGPADMPAASRFDLQIGSRPGKRGHVRETLRPDRRMLRRLAGITEFMVPIRLDCEHDVFKLRETFTWNLRDPFVTPAAFATHLCEDLRLPHHPFLREITTQIEKQLQDATILDGYENHLLLPLKGDRARGVEWYLAGGVRRSQEPQPGGASGASDSGGSHGALVDTKPSLTDTKPSTSAGSAPEFKFPPEPATGDAQAALDIKSLSIEDIREMNDGTGDELRILIKIDITFNSLQLVDQFEWDISDPDNSPEEFSTVFCAELGLAGEFTTAVAHAIREQVEVYVKSLCLLGYTGGPIPDEDLRREFLPANSQTSVFRRNPGPFTPLLNTLTPDEIDRNDKEREREARRKRRQTKGRGVNLPDREPIKTHRSFVPRPSLVQMVASTDHKGDVVYPEHTYYTAPPIAREHASPPRFRRGMDDPITLAPVFDARGRWRRHDDADEIVVPNNAAGMGRVWHGRWRKAAAAAAAVAAANNGEAEPVVRAAAFGLHPHLVNGHWFCANCGIPESLVTQRCHGPTGEGSLCDSCSDFYHRYKRPRVVQYSNDIEFHKRKLAIKAKRGTRGRPPKHRARKSGGGSALSTVPAGAPAPVGPAFVGPSDATAAETPGVDTPGSPDPDDTEPHEPSDTHTRLSRLNATLGPDTPESSPDTPDGTLVDTLPHTEAHTVRASATPDLPDLEMKVEDDEDYHEDDDDDDDDDDIIDTIDENEHV